MFKKCLELVKRSENPQLRGKKFVHLNHFGEPLLHPKLPQFIRMATDNDIEVSFATNGVDAGRKLFPRELWRQLAEAGLRGVIVSCHVKSERVLRNHIEEFVKIYYAFTPKSRHLHNWVGQVDIKKFNPRVLQIPDQPCDYEIHNMFAITWDGRIAACCYDIEAKTALMVDDVLESGFSFKHISLCKSCGLGRGDIGMLVDDFSQIVD